MGSGRAEKGYRASHALYPGPNGALSPASPPGFVTALTTARSRDVPAECFDERLPRRLPHLSARVLALVSSLCPASSDDPIDLTIHLLECDLLQATPHLLRNDAVTVMVGPQKRNPGTLKLYKKFMSTRPDAASRAMRMGWWIR